MRNIWLVGCGVFLSMVLTQSVSADCVGPYTDEVQALELKRERLLEKMDWTCCVPLFIGTIRRTETQLNDNRQMLKLLEEIKDGKGQVLEGLHARLTQEDFRVTQGLDFSQLSELIYIASQKNLLCKVGEPLESYRGLKKRILNGELQKEILN